MRNQRLKIEIMIQLLAYLNRSSKLRYNSSFYLDIYRQKGLGRWDWPNTKSYSGSHFDVNYLILNRRTFIRLSQVILKMPGTDISYKLILKTLLPLKAQCSMPYIGLKLYQLGVHTRAKKIISGSIINIVH